MTTRLPNIRYVGDGCYVSHDGHQLIVETSDGITVTNRIGISSETMEQLSTYARYASGFYASGQHRVPPGCESCRADLSNPASPLRAALSAEVYHVEVDDLNHEVRLCGDCARTADEAFLHEIIAKRPKDDRQEPDIGR